MAKYNGGGPSYYEQAPARISDEPSMPAGGWAKPKGWTASDEQWLQDCRTGGLNYANKLQAERRAEAA